MPSKQCLMAFPYLFLPKSPLSVRTSFGVPPEQTSGYGIFIPSTRVEPTCHFRAWTGGRYPGLPVFHLWHSVWDIPLKDIRTRAPGSRDTAIPGPDEPKRRFLGSTTKGCECPGALVSGFTQAGAQSQPGPSERPWAWSLLVSATPRNAKSCRGCNLLSSTPTTLVSRA